MKVEVSYGEAIDKLSILHIKREHATKKSDIYYIDAELDSLRQAITDCVPDRDRIQTLEAELLQTNRVLWTLEDQVRLPDTNDTEIARLARMIFTLNEQRANLKRRINEELKSPLQEVKIRSLAS
jgi:hypothetical protein